MAAPKGNKFWEARSSHGRKPIFACKEDLWNAACEYFKWVEDNPLWEAKLVSYQGVSEIEYIPKLRVMTEAALCLFLDIGDDAWRNYKARDGFVGVSKAIEEAIRQQKLAGAAADLFNANIIARDLGLRDNKDVTSNGGSITPPSRIELVAPQLDDKGK